jgi:hypothetical protein
MCGMLPSLPIPCWTTRRHPAEVQTFPVQAREDVLPFTPCAPEPGASCNIVDALSV